MDGKVNDIGMIIDTRTLTNTVEKVIIAQVKDAYLNDFIHQPTLENIAVWIYDELKPYIKTLKCVRLYENPTLFVEYSAAKEK